MNTITETPPDLDRLQADSEGRVGELQSRRAGLALDALTDPAAAERLAQAEADLSEAEAELARLGMARAESERRKIAAAEEAESAAQAAALQRARELQVRREVEAGKLDKAAKAFVAAAVAYCDAAAGQGNALAAAGRDQAANSARSVLGYRIESAVAYYMREAGAQRFLERMPTIREPHKMPLLAAEKAGRAIAPPEGS